MKCLETEDCWCADCTDRAIAADMVAIKPHRPSIGPVEIAWIFENGLEQKLTQSVRCF